MNEFLRNWSRNSLKSIHSCSAGSSTIIDTSDSPFHAQSLIETAAFCKLLELRGVQPTTAFLDLDSRDQFPHECLMSLVSSCPLNESSQPEELGELHESLVAMRGIAGPPTGQRSEATFRKRSGTFYTPQLVVDEILRITLLQRLQDGKPNPAEVAELSLLDPAAGCGAFLATAYRRLLDWHLQWFNATEKVGDDRRVVSSAAGPKLTFDTCRQILMNSLFGVDLDPAAIEVVRRTLWLILIDFSATESRPATFVRDWNLLKANFKQGHSLIGASFSDKPASVGSSTDDSCAASQWRETRFDWPQEFPKVAQRGGFDFVVGNPPYRRERDFKEELDLIQQTSWGRRHQSARMDLWYYFVHRGIDLLKQGGTLSFITNAYWMQGSGSSKLIAALREQVRVDELFLLRKLPVFPGVSGQHLIFKLTRADSAQNTLIRIVAHGATDLANSFAQGSATVQSFEKSHSQLFAGHRLDLSPSGETLLKQLQSFPRLSEFGEVRQGIAENPSTINRRTSQRFPESATEFSWALGEGVFSLTAAEVLKLQLTPQETVLLRPYHELCDLDRYWSAPQVSRQLLYSTPLTCPSIDPFPNLKKHLMRFRAILDARRETRQGSHSWWHLHWPRDERIWLASKLSIVQMAIRPSVVPIGAPSYVPFSVNVFVPLAETPEHLNYFCAILNSRILWAWFAHYGKRRGIGLELNGHVLKQAPIARINFSDPEQGRLHDELVQLVDRRMSMASLSPPPGSPQADRDSQFNSVEFQIEMRVQRLFGLESRHVQQVDEILSQENH